MSIDAFFHASCMSQRLMSVLLQRFVIKHCSKVHVHEPPAVILYETYEEFHIFTGLCQKI